MLQDFSEVSVRDQNFLCLQEKLWHAVMSLRSAEDSALSSEIKFRFDHQCICTPHTVIRIPHTQGVWKLYGICCHDCHRSFTSLKHIFSFSISKSNNLKFFILYKNVVKWSQCSYINNFKYTPMVHKDSRIYAVASTHLSSILKLLFEKWHML